MAWIGRCFSNAVWLFRLIFWTPRGCFYHFCRFMSFPVCPETGGLSGFCHEFLPTKCTQKGVTGATYWPSLSCSTTWPFDDFNEETAEEMEGWMQLDFHSISSGSDLDTASLWKNHPKGMWFNNPIRILLIIPLPRGVFGCWFEGLFVLWLFACVVMKGFKHIH